MMKIGIVVGTRPEAIKLLPIYFELRKRTEVQVVLISTGQHKEMLDQVLHFFKASPDYLFEVMSEDQGLSGLSISLMEAFQNLFKQEHPDLVIVQGDTTTAFIAALSSYYHKIPVAHVEAGLRTGNIYAPFPEEVNRKAISTISALNFAPTKTATEILEKEGASGIHLVGNTVIDSLLLCMSRVEANETHYYEKFKEILSSGKPLISITAHRRENFGNGLEAICGAIETLAKEHPEIQFVFPVHLNPSVRNRVHTILKGIDNVFLLEPLAYDDFSFIMSRSLMILTDSGGIQEEAPTLNIPVIVMRDTTEREEGLKAGGALLAGTTAVKIVHTVNELIGNTSKLQAMRNAVNPFGDGKSSIRIVDVLIEYLREA